ncbi:hypothetical protein B0J14DRAFT_482971 [Halenospora varia]|nr:hypothetical protein B0J14DRAFT_482971 [Halenospora varia]
MKTIVILGGSYGGISTAHRILKQSAKTGPVKVILVSPNTHLFWNLASARAIVPGEIPDSKIFEPIAPGFKQYPASQFEFIIATAESFDPEAKSVVLSASTGSKSISYDILILATGSHLKSPGPFKPAASTEETQDILHDFQARVKTAKSIVVAGAGATGVETAGELGFKYGLSKEIVLIASGATILEGTPASVSKTATKQLQAVKVSIKLSTKIRGSAKTLDGKEELTLSDGSKMTTDLYIPTMGLVPNSTYIPANLLNASGFVNVDEYLKVKGVKDVWAVGDVSAVERPQYVNTEKQSVHVAKNITLLLSNKQPVIYKVDPKQMMAVPVGKKTGTGHMGNMKLPSFMVVMVKGKGLFMDKMGPVVSGAAF